MPKWHRGGTESRRVLEIECTGEAYIEDFDTDVLIDELLRRKEMPQFDDVLCSVYDAIRDHRMADAMALLERYMRPKWPTVKHCEDMFQKSVAK